MILTKDEIEIVNQTWSVVNRNLNGIGLIIFKQFFEDNPTYQAYFSFRDVETWSELVHDRRMKAHATALMHHISMIIQNMHDGDVFEEMIQRLAQSHVRFHLSVVQFDNFKHSLVKVMVKALGEKVMNEEAIDAWYTIFEVINRVIRKQIATI